MTPNTGQRKGLLASARGTKEPKRPPKYRRGGVANSGASLQPRRPDPEAGKAERENAKFLGQMNEFLFGKGMVVDQAVKSEKERGIAEFEKATAEQREGFRDAITNGWIDSKENPYFREGVTVSYTKNLLTKTSLDLYTEYEKWEGKNDPNSGAFEKWLETQDEKIAINLESIPDSILANNFYEPHQAIKRQLAQQHAGYLNKEYRDKANAEVDLRFNGLMKQYSEAMGLDLGSDPNTTVAQILKKQGITQEQAWRIGGLLKTVPKSGDNVGIMPKESLRQLELMAVNEGGIAADTLYNYNGTEVDDLRAFEDAGLAWDDTPQGQDIAISSHKITPEANAYTIGEFALGSGDSTASQKRFFSEGNIEKQTEEFNAIIASRTFEKAYPELDYDDMMGQEYDKTLATVEGFSGRTVDEGLADSEGRIYNDAVAANLGVHPTEAYKSSPQYLAKASATDLSENELDRLARGGGQKNVANTFTNENDRVHGGSRNITFNSGKNLRKQTSLTKEVVKILKPDVKAVAETSKVVTKTWVSNVPLASGAGGNSQTMLDIVVAEGVKGGAHADWFKQLNVGGKGGIPKETLLAISHAFFDKHHEGLLKKRPKEGFESKRTNIKTRRVSSKFATEKVNQTAFVSFTENHPLFKPYKKSTGS